MNACQDASNKLRKLTSQLEISNDKVPILFVIVSEFPYLYGYWNQLLELDDISNYDFAKLLATCPTLDMARLLIKKTPEDQINSIATTILATIGHHYRSADIYKVLYEKSHNADILLTGIENQIYGYSSILELLSQDKILDVDTLTRKSQEIARFVNDMWIFESKLTRDYFHVLEIDDEELKAWEEYLNYAEKKTNKVEIFQLYQRCLIVTALYPKFWLMWIRWMLSVRDPEMDIRLENIIKMAFHYHPDDTDISLIYSRFLEEKGEIINARGLLERNRKELLLFDIRHRTENSIPYDALFQSDLLDPLILLPLWKEGKCTNALNYAKRLLEAGYIKEYLEVDMNMTYHQQ